MASMSRGSDLKRANAGKFMSNFYSKQSLKDEESSSRFKTSDGWSKGEKFFSNPEKQSAEQLGYK